MAMQNSPARSTIDVGSVIAGTYTIEALIGRGGMGAVFLASHARLPGKKVAIKVLHAEMSGDEVLARFKREAQIASLLSHPNIVHIEDYNVTADGMRFVMFPDAGSPGGTKGRSLLTLVTRWFDQLEAIEGLAAR